MKSLAILISIIISLVLVQAQPIQLLINSGLVDNKFTVVDLSDGSIVKNSIIDIGNVNIYSMITTDGDNVMFALSNNNDVEEMVTYKISNNEFGLDKIVIKGKMNFEIIQQPYGYDAVRNVTYLTGVPINGEVITIFSTNINERIGELITLKYSISGNLPVGGFDNVTSNYYIYYTMSKDSGALLTYNTLNKTTTHQLFKIQMIYPSVITDGQGGLYFLDANFFGPSFDIYSVDLENSNTTLIYSTPCKFPTSYNAFPYASFGEYLVLITSTKAKTITYTTVHLPSGKEISSVTSNQVPPNNMQSILAI